MSVSTSNASSQRSSAPGSRDVSPVSTKSMPDELAREIAVEQAHVDRVHEELEKAGVRADSVQAEGLARSQFGRQVEVGDAEGAALFERDALMFHAAKRRTALDTQYEGLVFGRLDIDHAMLRAAAVDANGNGHRARFDWNGGAAAPLDGRHRRRPRDPLHRPHRRPRRGLRAARHRLARAGRRALLPGDADRSRWTWCAAGCCAAGHAPSSASRTTCMRPEAPDDLVIVGDGALMAALKRARGAPHARHRRDDPGRAGRGDPRERPRRHRDLRRPRHRQDRRRAAPRRLPALLRPAPVRAGGILVVGPSGVFMAYIERVLPSLGEESVASAPSATCSTCVRHRAASTRPPSPVSRARPASGPCSAPQPAGACRRRPSEFRAMVAGRAVQLEARDLRPRAVAGCCGQHQRNTATAVAQAALGEAAWASLGITGDREGQGRLPRPVGGPPRGSSRSCRPGGRRSTRARCSWLADPALVRRHARGTLRDDEVRPLPARSGSRSRPALVGRRRRAHRRPCRSVGPVQERARGTRLLRDRGARRPRPVRGHGGAAARSVRATGRADTP